MPNARTTYEDKLPPLLRGTNLAPCCSPRRTNKATTEDVSRKILSIPKIHFVGFRLRDTLLPLTMTKRTWQEIRFWSVVSVLVISAAWLSHHYTSGYAKPHIPDLSKIPLAPATWDGRYPCVSASVTSSGVNPKLTNCSIPGENEPSTDTFEVDLRYDGFILRQTDLFVADEIPIVLTRAYASVDWAYPNPVHAFGRHANHRYDIAPVGSRFPYTYQYIVFEDGEVLFFPRITPGNSFEDAAYRHNESSGLYYGAVQQWEGRGWRLSRRDGWTVRFPDSYSSTNTAQAGPFEIRDGRGNRLNLKRNDARDLEEIRTEHGHFMRFRYDDQHRIVRAETDSGQWREYKYNMNSMLTDVVAPEGRNRHYEYDGDLLTFVMDGHGKVLLRNTFNGRWLAAQEFQGGGTYLYRYRGMPDGNLKVTMPNGETNIVPYSGSIPLSLRETPK